MGTASFPSVCIPLLTQPPEGDKVGGEPGSQGHTKVTGGSRFVEAPRWGGAWARRDLMLIVL